MVVSVLKISFFPFFFPALFTQQLQYEVCVTPRIIRDVVCCKVVPTVCNVVCVMRYLLPIVFGSISDTRSVIL